MDQLHTLQKLFTGRVFYIPDYQRGYAWEKRQWQDLIEDIELLPQGKQHYTGTVVLYPKGQVEDAGQIMHEAFDIVDGQQRLTTIVLLLDAVRDELEALDAGSLRDLAAGIAVTYIAIKDVNGQPLPRLKLNSDCDPFFTKLLQGSGSVEGASIRSHRLLKGADEHFRSYLASKRQEKGAGYTDWLREFHKKITQQLTFLVYAVGSASDVGVIFETMNNRGRPLSELEKVKNYLLYLSSKLGLPAPHDLAGAINGAWSHIFRRLAAFELWQPHHEDQLLRSHWLMAYDCDRRHWHGSRSVKERFNLRRYADHRQLLQDLSAYVQTLSEAATAYCDLYRPTHSDAYGAFTGKERAQVVQAGEKLRRLGVVAPFLPLLMAARLQIAGKAQPYLEAVRLCEKFAFRVYRWRRWRSNTGLSSLYRLGHDLYRNPEQMPAVLDSLRRLTLRYCPDQRFAERFSWEGENWFQWQGLKYFLYEYEEHLAGKNHEEMAKYLPYDFVVSSDRTVEHILPQNPREGCCWLERFAPEERARWTHDIGNLTLTEDNSRLGNRCFTEKRALYAKSVIEIERELAGCQQWTPVEIQARRNRLEEWAMARWHVSPPVAPVQPTPGPKRINRAHNRTVEEIHSIATRRNLGTAFGKILEFGKGRGLRLQPYRWVLVFAPPRGRMRCLFNIGFGEGALACWVSSSNARRLYGLSPEEFNAIMGGNAHNINDDNVDAFIEKLGRLFDRFGKL